MRGRKKPRNEIISAAVALCGGQQRVNLVDDGSTFRLATPEERSAIEKSLSKSKTDAPAKAEVSK